MSSLVARVITSIQMAVEALTAHKLRSGLTLLGVLIGVGGVLLIDSVTQAQNASVAAGLGLLGSNVLSVSPSAPTARGLVNGSGSGPSLRPTDADSLRQIAHVVAVSPEITRAQQVTSGSRSAQTTVTAATPDIQLIQGWGMRSGTFYTARDETGAVPVAVLGRTVVDRLFPNGLTNPIEYSVRIHNSDFKVVGTLAPKGNDGGGDLDDVVLVPFRTGQQRLFGTTSIGLLQLQFDGADTSPALIAAVTRTLERSHQLRSGQPDDFRVRSYQQLVGRAGQQVELLTVLMRGIALAALAMGGFGLMNVLLLGVTERTMEVGLRMAVGARPADVLVQFLVEGVTLALIGGLLGVVAGVGVGRMVPTLFASLRPYVGLPGPGAFASALGMTIGIGLIFGTYPAFRASRLDPVEALRSE